MTKAVLFLDGSGASFPIRVALETLGYQVASIGANPNQFQARLSATHYGINYSHRNQLATVLNEKKYVAAIPGCTDVSFKSYASLDEAYQCIDRQVIQDL